MIFGPLYGKLHLTVHSCGDREDLDGDIGIDLSAQVPGGSENRWAIIADVYRKNGVYLCDLVDGTGRECQTVELDKLIEALKESKLELEERLSANDDLA